MEVFYFLLGKIIPAAICGSLGGGGNGLVTILQLPSNCGLQSGLGTTLFLLSRKEKTGDKDAAGEAVRRVPAGGIMEGSEQHDSSSSDTRTPVPVEGATSGLGSVRRFFRGLCEGKTSFSSLISRELPVEGRWK